MKFLPTARRLVAALVALTVTACQAPVPAPSAEERLRERFGIPASARQVLVFGQNAHLDIDWQQTFGGYYDTWVEDIFLEARQLLESQADAVYSIAEMAYLRRHLERHPEERDPWRALAARGALRIVGGGITSPDTILPETELLLRDYSLGLRFADAELGVTPQAAWLPDSFGLSATTPDVLAALGFTSVAFSRPDGSPTFFEAITRVDPPPPKPGSSAELLSGLRSADFVWRGPGGGSVLAHWMSAGLYCAGDDIDYEDDLIQVPGGHVGRYRGDDPEFVDGQIDAYAERLGALAPTPYVFVPVGCDFQHPKTELLAYLEGYDTRRFPSTGIWAVALGFDQYAELLATRAAELPELEVDLTPYFMGFYGTRPAIKRGSREAARGFFCAETFATLLGAAGEAAVAAAAPSLERLTWSDHHDFVTGTANDAVVEAEQAPLLAETQAAGAAAAEQVLQAVAARLAPQASGLGRIVVFNPADAAGPALLRATLPGAGPAATVDARIGGVSVPANVAASGPEGLTLDVLVSDLPGLGWQSVDVLAGGAAPADAVFLDSQDLAGATVPESDAVRLVLRNAQVRATWERPAAGVGSYALTSLRLDGVEALAGPSFTTAAYRDEGGLWRLGNEMEGCELRLLAAADTTPDTLEVRERSPLVVHLAITGPDGVREARLEAASAALEVALTTAADAGTTRTAAWRFAAAADVVRRTGAPGGFLERPVEHVYSPTFWPAVTWAAVGPWVLGLRQSTGIRFGAAGEVELLTARDARREQCDVLGGEGSDPATHRFAWTIARADTPATAARLGERVNRPPWAVVVGAGEPAEGEPLALSGAVVAGRGEGVITAVKPADRGGGVIVRALLLPGPFTLDLPAAWRGRSVTRTDAAERDLETVGVAGASLTLERERYGAIATVRFR